MILEKIGKSWLQKKAKKDKFGIYKYKNLYFQILSNGRIDVFIKKKDSELPF